MARVVHALIAASLLLGGCGSSDNKPDDAPTADTVVSDPSGYVQVAPPPGLKNNEPTEAAHDLFFLDAKRDMAMAVIIDEPPLTLEVLTKTVLLNARRNAKGVNILSQTDAILGGLPAHRIDFIFDTEAAGPIFFINMHTATADHNIQVAVWGAPKIRDVVKGVADDMEAGAFKFISPVVARGDDSFDIDWDTLPIDVYTQAIPDWRPLKPGTLNEEAFLELGQAKRDLWFLAIRTPVAELSGQTFEDLARIMHTQMSLGMTALPPTDLGVFDEQGDDRERRWSLTGLLSENATPILHRFRLVRTDQDILQMYCWGNATSDVKRQCDDLYDALSPKGASPTQL